MVVATPKKAWKKISKRTETEKKKNRQSEASNPCLIKSYENNVNFKRKKTKSPIAVRFMPESKRKFSAVTAKSWRKFKNLANYGRQRKILSDDE